MNRNLSLSWANHELESSLNADGSPATALSDMNLIDFAGAPLGDLAIIAVI